VSEQHAEREQRVTSFELFFDLVFVFGFTQVTTVLSDDPTWSGLAHGLLILGALWWAWAAYAWLTNTVNPDEGAVWGAMLVAMAAMFVAALAVPEAFGRHGVVFGVAFLVVNVMYLTLYALGARGDRDLLTAILRSAPSGLAGAVLIIAAGFLDGGLRPLLWLAALVIGLHDARPSAAHRPDRRAARRPRARCLHLPAPADGDRHRPLRVRAEDDAGACR
jgi:low temperature requirement protein LtrA